MAHALVEIPRCEWEKLRDLYGVYKKAAVGHSLLGNYIRWAVKDPEMNVKIYSLDETWKTDGTFLIIDADMYVTCVYFDTLNQNLERLREMLDCLDTNHKYLLFGFRESNLRAFKQHLLNTGRKTQSFEEAPTIWYHIEREKALEFDVEPPVGIKLSCLQMRHAEIINNHWPHGSPGSITFVERILRLNDNVGAFDKDDNLIGWCLRTQLGSLGLLQVLESHQRQGIGNLLVRHMARCIAAKNEEVFAPVILTNSASRAVFEKLRFYETDKVYFASYELNDFFSLDSMNKVES